MQLNRLDNSLAENEPSKCAAVIGIATNTVHLLASLIAPYMPDTANSINAQLRADPLLIPDRWNADSIKPGHEIGRAEHLFTRIKPERADEWRKMYGSDETKRAKEEEIAIKAKRKTMTKVARSGKPNESCNINKEEAAVPKG